MGKQITKISSNKVVIIFLVLVLVIGLVSWFNFNNQPKDKTTTVAPVWIQYKNEENGVKFEYLKSWGTPFFTATKAKTGTDYSINFSTPSGKVSSIVVAYSSKDRTSPGCGGQCVAYTKEMVLKELTDPSKYIKYDSSSYATYFTEPASKIAGSLSLNQIINLTKSNASAVQIAYTKAGDTTTCPTDKLAESNNQNCITEADYQDLNRFAKSIQNI